VGASAGNRAGRRLAERTADVDIAKIQAELLRQYGSLDKIQMLANGIGASLASAWGDKSIAGLTHFTTLSRDFVEELERMEQVQSDITATEAQLADLRSSQIPTWRELEQIAKDYGIDVQALGANFGQLKTTDMTAAILSDFERLKTGGVDVGTILTGMSDEISQLVQDSLHFGAAIPENMRPLVEELLRAGKLTDDQGQKFKDLTGIKWGEAVKTDAEKLTTAIEELVKKLGELVTSLTTIPKTIPDPFAGWVPPEVPDFGVNQGLGGTAGPDGFAGYAEGGYVPNTGLAFLHQGEVVIPKRTVQAMNGGSGTTQQIQVILDGRVLADAVARNLPAQLRVYGVH
jgi:polyhydroxyalkanoate synthesis regulator phasin